MNKELEVGSIMELDEEQLKELNAAISARREADQMIHFLQHSIQSFNRIADHTIGQAVRNILIANKLDPLVWGLSVDARQEPPVCVLEKVETLIEEGKTDSVIDQLRATLGPDVEVIKASDLGIGEGGS